MKKSILILSFGTLLFASCKKEDEKYVATKENLAGSYKTTAAAYAGVNVFNNSDANMNLYEACERDDVFTLNANSTYTVTDAGATCSPSTNDNGSWEFVNSTTIKVDGETATIKSWDGKTLVTENSDNGATLVVTMTKQ